MIYQIMFIPPFVLYNDSFVPAWHVDIALMYVLGMQCWRNGIVYSGYPYCELTISFE
jgi:hypothetical protein